MDAVSDTDLQHRIVQEIGAKADDRAGRSPLLRLRARDRPFGSVPGVGHLPVAVDRRCEIAPAVDKIRFRRWIELVESAGLDARHALAIDLADVAQVNDEKLQAVSIGGQLAAVFGPCRWVGKCDGEIQTDRVIDLTLTDPFQRLVVLHKPQVIFPRQRIIADPNRVGQEPFDVLSLAGFPDRDHARMLRR